MNERFNSARLLFWDFDGVIKESVAVKTSAFRELFAPYGRAVADKVAAHHVSHGGMSRYEKIPLYLRWAGLPHEPADVRRFCDKFAAMVEDAVVECAWVPGVRECLASNRGKRKHVLVTATPQGEIESIIDRLSLSDCFDRIFGAPTKKAAAIKEMLCQFQVDSGDALMIGDSMEDYRAAQLCAVPFLLRRTRENETSMPTYTPCISDFE